MRTIILFVLFGIWTHAQTKSSAILLASGGGEGAWRLRQALVNSGGFDVRITEELAELTASTLARYDAVLLDCGSRSWTPAVLQSIRTFVEAGKGLAVVRRPDCPSSFNLVPGSNQQTTAIGKGRVFQTAVAPGFEDPENLGLVVQGVRWAVKAIPSLEAKPSKPVKAWIVTGGHSHDPSFYELFENDADIAPMVEPHPTAYKSKEALHASDVLVLYDSVQEIPDDQRNNLVDFVSSGKGVVVVHHALVDWCNWEWWYRDVVGARWLQTADSLPKWKSIWKHDVQMTIRSVGKHPVTKGVGTLQIQDETYKGLWFSPDIQVLMRTDDPSSDGPVAWISPFKKSRVVVIQLGHDYKAHRHPGYRRLIRNAVLWASGKEN